MNYLGHLYFSGNDVQLMQANLYGDFIKGSGFTHLPETIQNGIRLHRQIDHFIDHHPVVIELMTELRKELPRISGIAVDIYFDHLLARHWDDLHPQKLSSYLHYIYTHFDFQDTSYSADYLNFLKELVKRDWISYYPNLDAVDKMCRHISGKLSFANELHKGKTVFVMYEKHVSDAFFEYMTDANEHFLTEELRILS